MNGATAGLCDSTINPARSSRKTMRGTIHHFLRARTYSQNSRTIETLLKPALRGKNTTDARGDEPVPGLRDMGKVDIDG